ncbi:MAG TPA: CRISPR-associated helicase Cas3' [Rubrobacteraceae bacterium]|nr:CRISPR-associated helicase Cas3' [Rubrobacteraceae bacterium]
MQETRFFAHTPVEDGDWHDLLSHLKRTADLARGNGAKFGAGELARLAGLWHDIGKFNPEFQLYLRECEKAKRESTSAPAKGTPHAIYGAVLAYDSLQALAAIIYGHHAGLPNGSKLRDAVRQSEVREKYESIVPVAREEIEDLDFRGDVRDLFVDPPRDELQMEMLQRMIFSALVDADFLDTETHFDPGMARLRGAEIRPEQLWDVFQRDRETFTASSGERTTVNEVREEVYRFCVEAGERPQGVYRLGVPTGGGKTRSGLAFALRHAVEHSLDRVIFAVPYTSIIEQTASVYREIFEELGESAVLEHHSAVRREEGESGERQDEIRTRSRLAAQNWDAPLVVTTTVQLFESLFANRTSRCRKLHNLCRSVIVLDEVQTLPVGLLGPTVSALRELVRRYEVTVILCTATQPALDERSKYLEGFESIEDIVPAERAAEHFRTLRRVEYETPQEKWYWDEVARQLLEASSEKQAMVVLNTRKDALALLEKLEGEPVLHLSTLLCGAHRRDVLAEVRRRLEADEPCLLIATQVVEAGVDLDFPVVFRALGPLDRIVQAAGRCNREGKMEKPGRVVVFRPEEGRVPRGEYAAALGEAEIMLYRDGFDLHDPEIFREYFRLLYQDVPTDTEGIQKLRREFDYPEVARLYRLISDASVPVIVRYPKEERRKPLENLLGRIRRTGLWSGDHRRLQPYVVSMFEREFEKRREYTEEISEGVFVWNGNYDELRGIEDVSLDPADLVI